MNGERLTPEVGREREKVTTWGSRRNRIRGSPTPATVKEQAIRLSPQIRARSATRLDGLQVVMIVV